MRQQRKLAVQRTLDLTSAPEVYRPALVAELRDRPYEFDIQVQLCTDLDHMPVENLTVRWPENISPFVTVAKLRLPFRWLGIRRRRLLEPTIDHQLQKKLMASDVRRQQGLLPRRLPDGTVQAPVHHAGRR